MRKNSNVSRLQVRDEYRKDYDPGRGGWNKMIAVKSKSVFLVRLTRYASVTTIRVSEIVAYWMDVCIAIERSVCVSDVMIDSRPIGIAVLLFPRCF
jgi:hypothetical protein